jgi:hypothetical protein
MAQREPRRRCRVDRTMEVTPFLRIPLLSPYLVPKDGAASLLHYAAGPRVYLLFIRKFHTSKLRKEAPLIGSPMANYNAF